MQTAFDIVDDKTGTFCSDERKWINKIHKLQQQNPGLVKIIREPDQNDGCILCKLPANWLKISPPRKVELTDDERIRRANRLKNSLNCRQN